jgi:PIN domain nuclease of toxin-antitoxin system
MRILLDSHVFVWAKSAPGNLSNGALAAIVDPGNDVFVSVASAWELWIKHVKKPIAGFAPVLDSGGKGFLDAARESRIDLLDITLGHAAAAAALGRIHKDPFDRMLIAQAIAEKLTLMTADPVFKRYKGIRILAA